MAATILWTAFVAIVALSVAELTMDGAVSKFTKAFFDGDNKPKRTQAPVAPTTEPVAPTSKVEKVDVEPKAEAENNVDDAEKREPNDDYDFRSEATKEAVRKRLEAEEAAEADKTVDETIDE